MSTVIPPLSPEDGQSKDLIAENIARLKQLFPEIVTDGKVDFDQLREVLGDYTDERQERYSFTWNGKQKAKRLANTRSLGTLRPAPEESVNWDRTENLFIEGDNLEVLKLLQRSYHKKVKMIYIDPPYNTGKDFVYPDDYRENIKNYFRQTGQVDQQGRKISSNPEYSGRYHTDWLNMMYPRLKVGLELLREDGVIFISIDDRELGNMLKICEELIGDNNKLIPFIWELPRGINAGHISRSHEYILAYAKNRDLLPAFFRTSTNEYSIDRCNKRIDIRHPATKIAFPAGIRYEGADKVIRGKLDSSEKVTIHGVLEFKNNKLNKPVVLEAGWTMKDMIQKWLNGEDVYDTKGQKIVEFFFRENGKLYSKKIPEYVSSKSIIKQVGDYQDGRKEMESYFGSQDIFDYPKPSELVKYLVKLTTAYGDMILDYFSGSSPTADAVLNLNDDKKRRFILVQIPEIVGDKTSEAYKQGFKNIADIGKERIRKTINKASKDNNNDLGFKVFKLDSSNIKPWDPDTENLQMSLEDAVENIKPERNELDVLYEVLLKYGLDLSLPIEEKQVAGARIFIGGAGALVLCLSGDIGEEVVQAITEIKESYQPELMRVVFRDSGFRDDVLKTNALQQLKQHGIEDVRSI